MASFFVKNMGKFIIIIGLILVLVGIIMQFADKIPWIGRLPGDILIKKENFTFYFPLVTSIILSIIISFIIYLIRKFGGS
jgi:hypothetical protein